MKLHCLFPGPSFKDIIIQNMLLSSFSDRACGPRSCCLPGITVQSCSQVTVLISLSHACLINRHIVSPALRYCSADTYSGTWESTEQQWVGSIYKGFSGDCSERKALIFSQISWGYLNGDTSFLLFSLSCTQSSVFLETIASALFS